MANASDNLALQVAIDRALEKERKERGFIDVPVANVRYISNAIIGKKIVPYTTTDLTAFIAYVSKFQRSFPNVPIHIYTYTEVEPAPSIV